LVATHEILSSNEDDGLPQTPLIIASGQWSACYAADVFTGDPVCINKTESSE
jgi:hypothetical protein